MIRLAILLFCAGCDSAAPAVSTDTDAGSARDGGAPDAGPPDAGRADGLGACVPPDARLGASEGRTFGPLELERCDGSLYDFHGPDGFCSASLTVILLEAGWCVPSRQESARLEAEIAGRYAADGVRVVQLLEQNEDYAAPTSEDCGTWETTYGYREVILVRDPFAYAQVYNAAGEFPTHLVVDDTATIRYVGSGLESFDELPARIDALLAE